MYYTAVGSMSSILRVARQLLICFFSITLLDESGAVQLPPSLLLVLAAISFFFTLIQSYVLVALGLPPLTILALAAIAFFFLGVPFDGPPSLRLLTPLFLALAAVSLPLSLLF